ncbi:hypothetical protein PS15m_012056 [Mucor circinelloides]
MPPKEVLKRKRGRPPVNATAASTTPPPLSTRKSSSRIAQNTKKSTSTPDPEPTTRSSSRKRGRPSTYYPAIHAESDAKRKRESSRGTSSAGPKSPLSDDYEEQADEDEEVEEEVDVDQQDEKSVSASGEENSGDSDIDDIGETKVDRHGRLLEGREYKVPTFTLPSHGEQVLMLATECTKLLGYRDSYLFFHKHPLLKRVRINDEEKAKLKDMGMLMQWFKHRDVAVVTARSVFKCFGHKIIKRGRRTRDDYYENGHPEEKATSKLPAQLRKLASSSDNAASGLYVFGNGTHTNNEEEEENDGSRKSLIAKTARSEGYTSKAPLTNQTWMHHAALAARGFNAQLHERRAAKPTFYDIHSNINQVPASYQSTSCKFEFTKGDSASTPLIEFESQVAIAAETKAPVYRGIGKFLLECNVDAVVEAYPGTIEEKEKLRSILANEQQVRALNANDDDSYPLAIMEGQFQAQFPIHQARFNYPTPKVPDPTDMVDTAQSLAAQQFYLGLVYQSVNQFADPARQSSMGRSPQSYSPAQTLPPQQQQPQIQHTPPIQQVQPLPQLMQPQPSPQQIQQPPRMPIPIVTPEPPMCRTMLPGNQMCRNPVNKPGEKCPAHQPQKQMSDFAKGPPPQIVYSDNKCADCHQLKAAESLFNSPEEHVTDDFAVVKCSKCTRKYHPVCANLTTPFQVAAVESYPWSCPECKICCVCKSAGDESTLMICDGCDRGWHTGCCNPKVENVPEGSWLCQFCANCHSCDEHGMEEESQYTHAIAPKSDRYKYPVYLATYCPKCNGNFKDDRFCTVCLKTYSEEEENDDEDNEMVACDTCDHWVHTRCDEQLTPEKYQILCDDEEAKYKCPMCEDRFKRLVDTSTADLALKGLSAPCGTAVGLLGGKIKTRGIVKFKDIKIGVPEINGTGIAEMPTNK